MKTFKSLTLGCAILAVSAFYHPVKAQSLEIVFKDVLWGMAIGTTVMFVVWAAGEEPETDKLGTKLLQGWPMELEEDWSMGSGMPTVTAVLFLNAEDCFSTMRRNTDSSLSRQRHFFTPLETMVMG